MGEWAGGAELGHDRLRHRHGSTTTATASRTCSWSTAQCIRIPEQVRAGDLHPCGSQNQLFRGVGDGQFEEVPAASRERPVHEDVGRGLAVGDLDNDGDPDLVITNNAGPVRVLLNRRAPAAAGSVCACSSEEGKRDAFGARAALGASRPTRGDGNACTPMGATRRRAIRGCSSFCRRGTERGSSSPGPTGLSSNSRARGRYSTLRQGTGRTSPERVAPAPGKRRQP